MDYRKITNKKSSQYKLLKRLNKSSDGLLRDNDGYIAVALGSYYGEVSTRYVIEFNDGHKVKVIKADEKADNDTIDGCYHKSDKSMMEIICNTDVIKRTYKEASVMGDFNYSSLFNGSIKSISIVKNQNLKLKT